MQITVKARRDGRVDIVALVRRYVEMVVPRDVLDKIMVKRLFPEATTGNRAWMYTITMPDQLQDDAIMRLLNTLQSEQAIEYAEVPVRRDPM